MSPSMRTGSSPSGERLCPLLFAFITKGLHAVSISRRWPAPTYAVSEGTYRRGPWCILFEQPSTTPGHTCSALGNSLAECIVVPARSPSQGSIIARRDILTRRMEELERTAQEMAGVDFELTTPADVSEVLFKVLKLPPPPCAIIRGSRHLSTKVGPA